MGRGRAKAKQTKVARQLKYGAVHSDLGALQAELSTSSHHEEPVVDEVETDDEDPDPYAAYYEDDDDEDASEESVRGVR
jgi:hypothetical protein